MCTNQPLNTFVIRFWQRSEDDSAVWIGQVQHLQSKEYRVFLDITTLLNFLSGFGVAVTSIDHNICLEAILGAMGRLEKFAAENDSKQFEQSLKTKSTVYCALESINKATKRLPISFRERFPNIPWQILDEMFSAASGNIDDIDRQGLWHLVKYAFPDIKESIEQALNLPKNLLSN